MSGGVDSSAAALLLSEQGYDVTGITLLLSGNEKDSSDSADVCNTVGIPHTVLDLRDEFANIVEKDFCDAYIRGETPNPCIVCNKRLKFGLLLDYADKNGFDLIATGHYVRKDTRDGVPVLRRASDEKKDQSYMLWQLSREQIERSVFPLAELTKDEIRAISAKASLRTASRKDSQDICFIPDGDYGAFIRRHTNNSYPSGCFLNEAGCIHTSQGMEFEYVGVFIGRDLYYEHGHVKTNRNAISKDDRTSGIRLKSTTDIEADKLIKRTYKVLLSRGLKGCYVYCEDEALREYIKSLTSYGEVC